MAASGRMYSYALLQCKKESFLRPFALGYRHSWAGCLSRRLFILSRQCLTVRYHSHEAAYVYNSEISTCQQSQQSLIRDGIGSYFPTQTILTKLSRLNVRVRALIISVYRDKLQAPPALSLIRLATSNKLWSSTLHDKCSFFTLYSGISYTALILSFLVLPNAPEDAILLRTAN